MKKICKICDCEFTNITGSHTKTHGISLTEYKLLFGIDQNSHCLYSQGDDSANCCKFKIIEDSEKKYCILHDTNENKNIELFNGVLTAYKKIVTTSKRDMIFNEVHFPVSFELKDAIVENRLIFNESIFYGDIELSKKSFKKKVTFRHCIIKGIANFNFSNFLDEADFGQSKFINQVTFKNAIFDNSVGFWKTEFHSHTVFVRTRFREHAVFMTSTFPLSPYYIRFMNTHFEKPNLTLFADLNLSGTLFRWTDLTEIKFENVKWPTTPKILSARRYVADEFYDWRSDSSNYSPNEYFDYVQDIYQQLKRNYEERRSYAEAGDFFYGEMECRRKGNQNSKYLPTWTNLYRFSSGYGQRYIRSGLILLFLIMLFSSAHMIFGLQPNNSNSKYHQIHYSSKFDFTKTRTYLSDLGATMIYCIEVLTREGEQDRLFKPITMNGEALNVTLSIIVYAQMLLFVLALRRHFKR